MVRTKRRKAPAAARTATVLATALAAALVGCAGGGDEEEAAQAPTGPSLLENGAKVSSVSVEADSMPEGDNRSQFEKYTAGPRLEERLTTLLRENEQLADEGGLGVRVTVTDFRLRSGALAFWVGAMAGADYYNVTVDALREGEVVKTFRTDTSTILGGIAYASPTQRSQRMINTLAERIHRGL